MGKAKSMHIYLRILSVIYFVGFALHLADLLNLRLKFSEMSSLWKSWIVFLVIMDLGAAAGLWRELKIGVALFLTVAVCQLIAYLAFKEIFGEQTFLVGFHIVTVGLYFILKSREKSHGNA